ncbi:type 1 fimbrial protein [Escherichia coli]|uniref:fimbrial protein n=1 Tax=Escherichia coli TaxID=562 RepID=UPI000BE5458F|nr:fimbrial protein [Escherichia coli]EFN9723663.1 type 1 fimbrial protein [Escherichia coli]EFN9733838.1 type 1 fimbrial protein [Escherichia coli]EFN9743506.1 type 1 fimbrial protein [Escherichia coli]EFO0662100.1 type 1 fimbrial protein [Escherichia coli]EMB3465081.1 type 1 fimbrial protein [Escherichia coli]
MKLKAIILATGLINCIAFSAQAVDSTITITGNVRERTCTVPSISVNLGDMYTSDFSGSNAASAWHDAVLTLTNCQYVSRVQATFNGASDTSNPEFFKNSATGLSAATGLAIKLEDKDNQGINFRPGALKTVNVSGNTARFNMRVQAIKTGASVTPGIIQSVITVTYTYS